MVLKLLARLIGDRGEKKLRALEPIVQQITALEPALKALSDEELRAKTAVFRERLRQGESIDALLPEAFAAVREASSRTTGMRHFDVQLIGGIVLHRGKISEMATGEGKTLVATLPAYLNALTGNGVHIVTVNDYLARRDSEWMGPIYRFLGLEVGLIQHDMDYPERKISYSADITYGTNNEFGFDYLRDNMAVTAEQCVQRELNYAIVDEVDSILIDEARTPLIISGMVEEEVGGYQRANDVARRLTRDRDFTQDEKTKNAVLTEEGIKRIEGILKIESLFDVKHMDLANQILQSLKAWHLFRRDVDYIIKDGEIIIVDEFTGRLMFGRRYSDGLHQAIEAKEGVRIREESQTLATITFQNYFRLYQKLAGMTGTAMTEEAEFGKIYNLEVMTIPTNQPLIRTTFPDVIYKTKKEKFNAVVAEIKELFGQGRPVLVGTTSIENNELLASLLRGIPHQVLNAKHHEREAEIIARAGQNKAVTIATNMAGRGTDIVLGEGVAAMGGLHVIGTERHESRRVDNQLRGRAGRQGDPGSSSFYVSLGDDLMKLFGSDRIARMMDRLGIEEGTPIEHRLVSRAIENAQKKVEQYHFNIRKQILEYDDVMNRQREAIYRLRRRILEGSDLKEKIVEMMTQLTEDKLARHVPEKTSPDEWDRIALVDEMNLLFSLNLPQPFGAEIKSRDDLSAALLAVLKQHYQQKESELGPENMRALERIIMLRTLDGKWIDQLHNMDALRDGIGLRAYGQRDPLIEYKFEAFQMFQEMMRSAREEIIGLLLKIAAAPAESKPLTEAPRPRRIILGDGRVAAPVMKKTEKVGRNDPCPCGSGKKYKKCHGVNL